MNSNQQLIKAAQRAGVIALVSLIASVWADDEQTVHITSIVTGATCDVALDTPTVTFNSVTPQTFSQTPWQTSGELIKVNVLFKDCVPPGTGDPALNDAPSVQVDGDYNDCADGSHQCWRAANSTSDIGFLLASGDYRRLSGQRDSFYQQVSQDNTLVAPTINDGWVKLASAGTPALDGMQFPFTLAMTCGSCQNPVTLGEAHAAITFMFSYH